MIRLSTKGRYGTRAMLELALSEGNGPVLLREIAQRQGISLKYLEQITPSLKSAGLVNSSRGASGGYFLAKLPERINVKEIVEALEGPLKLVECVGDPGLCRDAGQCDTRDLWDEVSVNISKLLQSRTLADLAQKHKDKQKSRPLMYSI
jgi:Rrf2 family protein